LEPQDGAFRARLRISSIVRGRIYRSMQPCSRPQRSTPRSIAFMNRGHIFRDSPYLADAYAQLGRRDEALRVLNGLAKRGGPVDLQQMAIAYVALGDKERALEWLTKAFDQRSGFVPFANVIPAFDPIRSDPRFKALMARLNLPNKMRR